MQVTALIYSRIMWHTRAEILVLACLVLSGLRAQQSGAGEAQLQQAMRALSGEHKDTAKAQALLLDLVQGGKVSPSPETLSYAYVYLGYIEDRGGDRQRAIAWFEKALALEGGSPGILAVAREGLKQPVTWIRHLDEKQAPPAPAPRIGKAYVTEQPPTGLTPARNLTEKQRRDNFEDLWSLIDVTYADFKLKSIDWAEVKRRYQKRLEAVSGDDDFYLLMFQLVNELKDTHSWLNNYRVPMLADAADLAVDLFEGKPYVVAGAHAGWEVLSVDGLTVAEKMEALRPRLRACSSERAYQREAGRHLLAGEPGSTATVKLGAPDGRTETLTLRRQAGPGIRPPARTFAFELTRQHFVHFGRHPSGLGYIWIESFNGHQEIAAEFDRALEALRNAPGLILDIRDNPGGFGQPQIVGRFLRKQTLVSIAHIKNGPGHGDLVKREAYLGPTGAWQYSGPVALLVNDVTGSASDLFACELRSAGRVVTVGATTHGNLAGVGAYAVLPCGLVVRISNGYLSDAKGRPIEVNGNIPETIVEPGIRDFLNGKDPVLDRAVSLILK
jgi:carboxyl-terminal processing protease